METRTIDDLLPSARARRDRLSGRDRRVILVCADGFSSSLAAATFGDLGFARATDLVGGFNGWVAAGLPVERVSDG